jgi:hypothetical protein
MPKHAICSIQTNRHAGGTRQLAITCNTEDSFDGLGLMTTPGGVLFIKGDPGAAPLRRLGPPRSV